MCDTHLVHGAPFPAKWFLVFWSFTMSSQRLNTALSLVYNNNVMSQNYFISICVVEYCAYSLVNLMVEEVAIFWSAFCSVRKSK